MSADKRTEFTVHDKAYYADANTVNFVRPGFVIKIKSAGIAADGTISVNYTLSDPKGAALDKDGIQTPGSVSTSFIAAYIPQGASEFWAYTTRVQTSPITHVSANQASSDSGGTTVVNALGDYTYTFKTKAVAKDGSAWDNKATHRIGLYGSRNLTEFDLGTNYDDETITWIPAGGTPTNIRDVVKTQTCNKCHDSLAAHGGTRKSVELCIMCHQDQSVDPDTGNSVAMDIFIHKIHMGKNLPSVIAGKPYQIIGNAQSLHDYSDVGYPALGGVENCQTCHDPSAGATQQNAYLTKPSRNACGSCHDDVNFTSGLNHVNVPQASDANCTQCHLPTGDEFDTSVSGAHTVPLLSKSIPGNVITITKVDNGVAGKAPLVSFTAKDKSGAPITMAQLTGGSNALRFVMTGPTTDYGLANFGSDVTTAGYVSETANVVSKCDTGGNCTYQFTHSIPATAKGTFAIGAEARRSATLNAGTVLQQTVSYGATNPVFYFSVDGSTVTPRRQIVDIAKCQNCHVSLQLHGANRNDNVQYCAFCHNPADTDAVVRPVATTPADKTAPAQGINMAYMAHRIHWGDGMAAAGASYIVVGNGGSHNDFGDVTYPAMGPTGTTGFVQSCYMCHVNGSEAVLPIGKNAVTNPSSPLSPAGATTSACTACHTPSSVFAHALSNTDSKFGESCDVCHGTDGEFSATKVHAVTR
jgi:OmcA/MtrC family decaheme c-type cytochrome